MAKPIELMPIPRDAREELIRRVENAPVEHAAAVLSAYELLGEMHKTGTLDLLRGVVGAQGEIIEHVAGVAAKPDSVRALRNLLTLGNLLSRIDPDTLQRIADSVSRAHAAGNEEKPPSLFQLFRRFFSADSRRALGVAASLTANVGKGLDPKNS